MTKADAARLVAIVVTAYPNFDKFKDAKAIEATVNLWAMMFEQDESGMRENFKILSMICDSLTSPSTINTL